MIHGFLHHTIAFGSIYDSRRYAAATSPAFSPSPAGSSSIAGAAYFTATGRHALELALIDAIAAQSSRARC